MPEASPRDPKGSSTDLEIQPASRDPVGSGARTGSLNDLDDFSLPGSLPGIESLPDPDVNSPIVVVHRSNDDDEMEALSVRQKRARTPSPHSSSRSSRRDKNKVEGGSVDGPLSKKSMPSGTSFNGKNKSKENKSNKVSLSRSLIPKREDQSKITPKSK